MLLSFLAVVPASATPGVAPSINGIIGSTSIDPGQTRYVKVSASDTEAASSWTFSADGVTASIAKFGATQVRLLVTAAANASGGPRSLTVTNGDGLFDTLANALTVTGDNPPVENGAVSGFVFDDANGNGAVDSGETGLSGAPVAVVDSLGGSASTVTDGAGNFTLTALAVGEANLTYTVPAGYSMTTGNGSQTVTVIDGASVAAADVGFQMVPSGTVTGHVFSDLDGNGVEDGADTALAGVSVGVTDNGGASYAVSTDGSGNFSVSGLAVGDATVNVTTPGNMTLTTANDSQVVAVTDGGSVAIASVGFQPPAGTPPVLESIIESDMDIDPGETRYYRVGGSNFGEGAVWAFSGTGLAVSVAKYGATKLRLSITASLGAEGGSRSLTVTNPDGLSSTLNDAITVTGDTPPPINGNVTGRVFTDEDGNGIEDGSDSGLPGVLVSVTDAAGATFNGLTNASGNFTIAAGIGAATVVFDGGIGRTLTTGNASQMVTIVEAGSVGTAAVGYQPNAAGDTTFVDVAGPAGLVLSHSDAGKCAPPIGVGAAWADIDNDGDQDLFTTDRTGPNRMYLNGGDTNGDGVVDFTNVAAALGIDGVGIDSFATVFVDYDNDGDQDLFIADSTGNRFFENQLVETGTLSLTDITVAAGLKDDGRVETASWGDIDNDGNLDLYLAKHMTCNGTNTDRLFHNNGDGTFTDWTTYLCGGGVVATCADVNGLGFAAGFLDYDGDSDLDIYLVNDNITNSWQPNKMFRNDGSNGSGGWVFTEVGAATNTNLSVNGMGLGIGDYNNDGWLDLVFSDAAPGHLLMNNGNGTYSNVSASSGVTAATAGAVGWGSAFLDFDNDQDEDIFFAQGSIGTPSPLSNALLENNGSGMFSNVSVAGGMTDEARGRNVSMADFDADGWVDVFVGNYDAPPLLMRNRSDEQGNANKSLTVTVEGTDSNRDAIGTVVKVLTAEGVQTRLISSGGNHGGGSQKAAFFGIGAHASAIVEIHWPNGQVQSIGVVAAGVAHFVEPTN